MFKKWLWICAGAAVLCGALSPAMAQDDKARQAARKARADAAYLELKGQKAEALAQYEKSLQLLPDPQLQTKVDELKAAVAQPAAAAQAAGEETSSAASVGAVVSHLDADGEFLVFLNTEGVVRDFRKQIELFAQAATQSKDLPQASELAKKADTFMEWLGLYGFQAYGCSMASQRDGKHRIKSYVARAGADAQKPFWTLGGGDAQELAGLAYAPADTAILVDFNAEVKELWNIIREGLQTFAGEAAVQQLDAGLEAASKQAELDLAGLINSLSDEGFAALCLSPTTKISIPMGADKTMDIPDPSLVIGLKMTDDQFVNKLVTLLKSKELPVVETDVDGLMLYSLNLPMELPVALQPTLTYQNGLLLLGSGPDAVKQALAAAKDKNGFIASAAYKEYFGQMPAKINSIVFVDPKLYELAHGIQETAFRAELDKDPDNAAVVEYFIQLSQSFQSQLYAGYSINLEDGVYSELQVRYASGLSPLTTLAAMPVGLLAAVAVPAFVKAKSNAQVAACRNNLMAIEINKSMWAAENNKVDGDVMDEAVLAELMGGQLPVCPAGGVYTIGAIGTVATCSIHGADESYSMENDMLISEDIEVDQVEEPVEGTLVEEPIVEEPAVAPEEAMPAE